LAEKSTQLLIEALGRAAAAPGGVSLVGGKNTPGLFAANAAGKQAAQQSKEEGLLRVIRTETRGKTTAEVCALTEKGLAFLLSQASPKQVLEEFLRALQGRQGEIDQLLTAVRRMQDSLDALKTAAERALQEVHNPASSVGPNYSANGSSSWLAAVHFHLTRRQESGATDDCPLPELYRHARQSTPSLSVGHFHDGLRTLYEQQQIYLHPWTGPLYDLPEPSLALLTGHEIAYYASLRSSG